MRDTTAPVVAAHISLFAEATSAAGAIVNYTASSATDAVTASLVISYSQDTGTLFPLGTTNVIIAAEDAANNVGSATFTITVQDTTAPLIAAHASVITEATSAAGAVVSYIAATVSDAVAASPAITYSQNSGTLFPLGATTVTITAKDAFTNTATATFTITVRDTTAPVLTLPLNQLAEATSPTGASVTYGTARATDIVTASPVISYSKNSGTTFPIAITGVLVTATDGAGRQTSGTFYVTVRDTTAPVLTVPADVSVGTPDPLGTVVTFPPATATDAATVSPGITYSQASGTRFPIGTSTVSVTAKDAANNTTTATFAVKVILTSVQTAALATAGAPVPGAGVDARIAAGAVWTSFGPPAVNDAAQIAFLGKWLAAKTTTAPAQKGAGIFLGTTLVAAAAENVPGLTGASFQSFRDPLIALDGSVAFTATTASGTLLMSTAGGTLTVVARTGDSLVSAGGAKWARFTGMWADTRGIAFTALLAAGTGVLKVKPSDDQVFCTWEPASGTRILLREGATIGLRRLARFTTFAPGLGSPGQGRGWAQADASGFRIGALGYFTDGTQSILRVSSTGTVESLCQSGASGPGLPTTGGIFKSYSFPAFASGMSAPAFLGTLVGGGKAIYQLDETTGTCDALAAVGAPVPAPTAAIFSILGDPVLSQDGATVAFLAKIKGSSIPAATTSTLWWQPDSGTLALLARTGTQPPEVPTGARWKTFTSLAMSTSTSGRGRPLFIGTMLAGKGGVTAANDIAVWSVDTPGALRLAFREGDTIAGKTVKNFRVLKATVGTSGITRSVNNTQTIVSLATYTDGTTGIVQTQVP